MSVLLGNANGTFRSAVNNAVGAFPSSVVVTLRDFNGDHIPDLAVACLGSSSVSIPLGRGIRWDNFWVADHPPGNLHLNQTRAVLRIMGA